MSESLPKQYKVSRSIPLFKNAIQSVDRHVFGYASKTGFSLNMYGIARQTGERSWATCFHFHRKIFQNQDLNCCCTCGYQNPLKDMAANILQNTRAALRRYLIKSCYGLFDNIVVF